MNVTESSEERHLSITDSFRSKGSPPASRGRKKKGGKHHEGLVGEETQGQKWKIMKKFPRVFQAVDSKILTSNRKKTKHPGQRATIQTARFRLTCKTWGRFRSATTKEEKEKRWVPFPIENAGTFIFYAQGEKDGPNWVGEGKKKSGSPSEFRKTCPYRRSVGPPRKGSKKRRKGERPAATKWTKDRPGFFHFQMQEGRAPFNACDRRKKKKERKKGVSDRGPARAPKASAHGFDRFFNHLRKKVLFPTKKTPE